MTESVTPRPLCRHCGKWKVHRPRGLCWGCYYAPGVRDLYPSTSKYARRGVGNLGTAPRPLPAPTDEAPGSPEKIAVLEGRARLGQALHHPRDVRALPVRPRVPGLQVPYDRRGRAAESGGFHHREVPA